MEPRKKALCFSTVLQHLRTSVGPLLPSGPGRDGFGRSLRLLVLDSGQEQGPQLSLARKLLQVSLDMRCLFPSFTQKPTSSSSIK